MGIRGRKPKATIIKLVTGNPGHHPKPDGEPLPEADPVKPEWLAGRASELWDELCGMCFWLRHPDSYKIAAWCERQAAFEIAEIRARWTAADRREHRSLGSELGLDPSSRARLGMRPRARANKNPAEKYFKTGN